MGLSIISVDHHTGTRVPLRIDHLDSVFHILPILCDVHSHAPRRRTSNVVWSKNPIRMKSKGDGSGGRGGPDGSVTPRYITKKSRRNVRRHGVLETSLTISRVFSKIGFLTIRGPE